MKAYLDLEYEKYMTTEQLANVLPILRKKGIYLNDTQIAVIEPQQQWQILDYKTKYHYRYTVEKNCKFLEIHWTTLGENVSTYKALLKAKERCRLPGFDAYTLDSLRERTHRKVSVLAMSEEISEFQELGKPLQKIIDKLFLHYMNLERLHLFAKKSPEQIYAKRRYTHSENHKVIIDTAAVTNDCSEIFLDPQKQEVYQRIVNGPIEKKLCKDVAFILQLSEQLQLSNAETHFFLFMIFFSGEAQQTFVCFPNKVEMHQQQGCIQKCAKKQEICPYMSIEKQPLKELSKSRISQIKNDVLAKFVKGLAIDCQVKRKK